MYVQTDVYIYIYIYVYISVFVYVSVCVCVCVWVHVVMYVFVHIPANTTYLRILATPPINIKYHQQLNIYINIYIIHL